MADSSGRLCMMVHAYYPLAEPRVQRAARAARDAGFDVTVIALRGPGEPARETIDGITVNRLPVRHQRGARLPVLVIEYLRFTVLAFRHVGRLVRAGPLGVIHVHAPPDFLILAALPGKLRGARVLLDIHDLSPHLFGARFGGRVASLVLDRVQAGAAAFADAVVTVHEPYRRELLAAGIREEKVAVVMNAPDEELIATATKVSERARFSFTVAYHGTLTHWYGVDLVVDAISLLSRRHPDVGATILGDGDALPQLQDQADRLGVAERVWFSGRYVPIEVALRSAAVADCGVIPNRPSTLNRFALSSKLFEYVALGVPVVVARLETLATHFSEDEVGFFEPGDPSSLAAAIRWVKEHPEQARARAARATERAREYEWAVQRERYLALLVSR